MVGAQGSPERAIDRLLAGDPTAAREGLDALAEARTPARRRIVDERLGAILDGIAQGRTPAVAYRVAALVDLASLAPERVAEAVLERAREADDPIAFGQLTLGAGRVCLNHETRLTAFAQLLVDNISDPARDGVSAMHLDELSEYHPAIVLEAWKRRLATDGWPER